MEVEWFAQRAALRCLARQHPDWTQAELAATLGRSRTTWRSYMPAPVPVTPRRRPRPRPSWSAFSRFATARQNTCGACRAPAPFCTTCHATPKRWPWACRCRARLAPSGRCCAPMGASPWICRVTDTLWSGRTRWTTSRWTSRMPVAFQQTQGTKSNTPSRCSTLWMRAPPACSRHK
jgi:hypothetical protein